MSHWLILSSWQGEDEQAASAILARVFKLKRSDATNVITLLASGRAWQFPSQVSDAQSTIAVVYLRQKGFSAWRIPVLPLDDSTQTNDNSRRKDRNQTESSKKRLSKLWTGFRSIFFGDKH